ncbi:2,3-bisphosphoglycerate-independent phosphoglycerate mutase [Helicobacter trogontum]|uniref:2,3-bisphosphoglycerate-independent phosphoglycerate mutase n=1 Tax=Helicobacter trogontum TaxID=50960 RepID=UPI002A90C3C7|nr:2,3-bisphosphoglycerate-independent phosphoglycerate mutase [Helicobacter trogontum]MDY5185677.1 2,3-bisphosphoglycerate-independent phosphoglycerate mutase [Helicobacter trogontum]
MVQKVVLIITDGIGYSEKTEYNAFFHAKKPHYDYLFQHVPHSLISTYGLSVGLPEGQMGNSEVGHMSLGSGRILYQDLVKINTALQDQSIKSNNAFNTIIDSVQTLHLCVLASDGGVHSHINHLKSLALLAKERQKKVWLHLITDGRDVKPQSFLSHLETLQDILCDHIQIGSICGRFYAMDRDKRWDRVQCAFDVLAYGENPQTCSIESYIQRHYDEGIFDEFIKPASFNGYTGFKTYESQDDQDFINVSNLDSSTEGFIFVNYRSDRAREIVASLGLKSFSEFPRKFFPNLFVGCMCEYDESFPFPILFPKDKVQNTIAEILSKQGLKQAHIAETEKYAHVTFFFNGGREEEWEGETRLLIESPKVKTYDLKPEMSAREVGDGVCEFITQGYDFIVVNFANGDMVGHTGNFEAAIKAVEAVDREIAKIWNLAKQKGYSIIMTSDHGNCEEMKDSNLKPLTNHTIGDVFCFVDSSGVDSIDNGALSNIAPTILKLMEIPIPSEMDKPLF